MDVGELGTRLDGVYALIPVIRQLAPPLLDTADCDDYRRPAELLAHIQA